MEPTAARVPPKKRNAWGAACNRGIKESHALPANFGRASAPIIPSRFQALQRGDMKVETAT
jgi:hypothetical protein